MSLNNISYSTDSVDTHGNQKTKSYNCSLVVWGIYFVNNMFKCSLHCDDAGNTDNHQVIGSLMIANDCGGTLQ